MIARATPCGRTSPSRRGGITTCCGVSSTCAGPGVASDERAAEAIDLVASKRDDDGRWPLETQYPGKMAVEVDEGEGRPSRWNTLRALRVLDWYSGRD